MLDTAIDLERQKRLSALLKVTRPNIQQVRFAKGDGTYQDYLRIIQRGVLFPLIPLQSSSENYSRR